MAEARVYPKGVAFFPPKAGAPTWVLGSVIITPRELFDWIKANPDVLADSEKYGKQLRLQVTDKGVSVDTWKPTTTGAKDFQKKPQEQKAKQVQDDALSDLPF